MIGPPSAENLEEVDWACSINGGAYHRRRTASPPVNFYFDQDRYIDVGDPVELRERIREAAEREIQRKSGLM